MSEPSSEKPTAASALPRLERILRLVSETCDRLGLPYYVTGSVASMFYSVPRTTTDVDVVVDLPPWKAKAFCAAFPDSEFYVDDETARAAADAGEQFNIVHSSRGVKADIMCFRETPYDECRLARRRLVEIVPGLSVYVAAPEDVILKKLDFYRLGGSEKHLVDIVAMFQMSGARIDLAYIESWAARIGVAAEWDLLKQRVREVLPLGAPGRP
jgi:hypothetical protein